MNDYMQARERIDREIRQLPVSDSIRWHYQFAVFSASFRWLLPGIPVEQHKELFRRTLLNQRLANLDEYFFPKLSVRWQGENAIELTELDRRPSLVCTYHTGSYRLLPHWLMARGISICTLLATSVLETQGEGMLALAAQTCRDSGATCTLIDAENRTAGLQILAALRRGKTVVAYLDGNTGTLANDMNTNLVSIPFLEGEMRVRTGLAALAYMAGVPLYSMVSEPVNGLTTAIHCLQTIEPRREISRRDFAHEATESLYSGLQNIVKRQPWIWENWLSVHEQLR